MRPGLLRVLRGADWKVSMAQRECCERAKADGTTSERSGWIMSTELNGNPWFREHEMKPWSFSSKLTVPLDCQSVSVQSSVCQTRQWKFVVKVITRGSVDRSIRDHRLRSASRLILPVEQGRAGRGGILWLDTPVRSRANNWGEPQK